MRKRRKAPAIGFVGVFLFAASAFAEVELIPRAETQVLDIAGETYTIEPGSDWLAAGMLNIEADGVTLDVTGAELYGVDVNARNVTIRSEPGRGVIHSRIYENQTYAVGLYGDHSGFVADGLEIVGSGFWSRQHSTGIEQRSVGLRADSIAVRNCYFHDQTEDPIAISTAAVVLVSDSWFHNVGPDPTMPPDQMPHPDMIALIADNPATPIDFDIARCYFWNDRVGGLPVWIGPALGNHGVGTVRDCIFQDLEQPIYLMNAAGAQSIVGSYFRGCGILKDINGARFSVRDSSFLETWHAPGSDARPFMSVSTIENSGNRYESREVMQSAYDSPWYAFEPGDGHAYLDEIDGFEWPEIPPPFGAVQPTPTPAPEPTPTPAPTPEPEPGDGAHTHGLNLPADFHELADRLDALSAQIEQMDKDAAELAGEVGRMARQVDRLAGDVNAGNRAIVEALQIVARTLQALANEIDPLPNPPAPPG